MKYAISTNGNKWFYNKQSKSFENVAPEIRHEFSLLDDVMEVILALEARTSIHGVPIFTELHIHTLKEKQEYVEAPNYIQLSNWLRTSPEERLRRMYDSTKDLSNPERVWRNQWIQEGKPKIYSLLDLARLIEGEKENV